MANYVYQVTDGRAHDLRWVPVGYVPIAGETLVTSAYPPLPSLDSLSSVSAPVRLPAISDRQFFQQLAIMGLITQDEALAAVKVGALPAAMVAIVASLDPSQQFAANMLLCGATIFDRYHPLVAAFSAAMGWTSVQTDALWQAAYLL